MIKLIVGGLWICAVTIASVYFTSAPAAPASEQDYMQGIDYVRTPQITVPRIEEGGVGGYIVARFVFTADATRLRQMPVPAGIFVVDEAFRAIYTDETIDFENLRKADLTALTERIAHDVNARLKSDLLQEVMIEQFDYMPRTSLGSEVTAPAQRADARPG